MRFLEIVLCVLSFLGGLYLFLNAFMQFEVRNISGETFFFNAVSGVILMIFGAITAVALIFA